MYLCSVFQVLLRSYYYMQKEIKMSICILEILLHVFILLYVLFLWCNKIILCAFVSDLKANVEIQSSLHTSFTSLFLSFSSTHLHNAQRLGGCRQGLHAEWGQAILSNIHTYRKISGANNPTGISMQLIDYDFER